MIHPECSSTFARRMLGSTSNSRTMRARTGVRTRDSGNVSLTRTVIMTPLLHGWPTGAERPVEAARAEPLEVEGNEK